MTQTPFGPLGDSVVLSLTQSSQTFALGTTPADGPAIRLQSLNSGQTAWYIKFGTSGAVTVSTTDGMRVVPGGQDGPVVIPIPSGSTHYAILAEGISGNALASYGGYDEATFSPLGASQVVTVTTTDQRIALPTLGTISPAIRLVATSPAVLSLWVKLGNAAVVGSVTTSMKVAPGSVEDPTIIPVTNGETHLSIFCEGVGGAVVLSPGQVDHSLPFPLSVSGNRFGVMASVGNDGVMEVGRYLDFHNSDTDTTDFAVRLETNGGTTGLFMDPAAGGGLQRIVGVINSTLAAGDVFYYNGTNFVRTVAGVAGNVLALGAAGAVAWGGAITNVAAQASTSGANIDFNSIPAGVKRIVIMFDNVSRSTGDDIQVQLGDSGGIETTGYLSAAGVNNGASVGVGTSTTGFILGSGGAGRVNTGLFTLCRIGTTNTWISSHSLGDNASADVYAGGGSKTLSADLDRLRITAAAGTFDLGQVAISYEF